MTRALFPAPPTPFRWRLLITPEWIWRHSIAILFLIQLAANRYYVTRAEYSADKQEFSSTLKNLNAAMVDLQWTLKVQSTAVERLNDHENRIRTLEHERNQK